MDQTKAWSVADVRADMVRNSEHWVDQGLIQHDRVFSLVSDLLIVIANARRNGNIVLRKSKGRSAEEE